MAPVILHVAEKPSIAESIAKALSPSGFDTRKGIATPVHEFNCLEIPTALKENNNPAKFRVTSVTGHIFSTDFLPEHQSWEKTDPKELFQVEVQKKSEAQNIIRHLKKEISDAQVLVLWLDCDREGENICFEVLKSTGFHKQMGMEKVFRAKFSSITSQEIKTALFNLGKPNKNESLAVDARQELDLRVGVAFSRFQTKFFQSKYADLNSKVISYGPCQTPTLGFCVQRHDEIQQFVPEKFWRISLKLEGLGSLSPRPQWSRGRVFDHRIGLTFLEICSRSNVCRVTEIKEKNKSHPRPIPLNTVGMLKAASSGLGLGPQEAMRIAEHLYLRGYISYPRTETTTYPKDFNIQEVIHQHLSHPLWGDYLRNLPVLVSAKKGVDMGDHPPITPVTTALPSELSGDEWKLYEYICRHFIASVSPDAKSLQVSVGLDLSGTDEKFTLHGTRMISSGFFEIMPWLKPSDEIIPEFKENQEIRVSQVELLDGETSPPGYLTESELISLMEKHGIGTDASISVHIHNIVSRNYVHIGNSRTLIPNDLGIALVHGYLRIDPELVLPSLRSYIEKQVNLIAEGKASYKAVVDHAVSIFLLKFEYFQKFIGKMDALFEPRFSTIEDTKGKLLSRCGKCRRAMKYISIKPARLYCPTCDETYKLPDNGKIKLYMEKKCPLDNFELVLFSTTSGSKGISYPICPLCFNQPPFENIPNAMSCNKCIHPTCKQSMVVNSVSFCDQDNCEGSLVFDSTSGPLWKLCCNSCNFVVLFAEKARKCLLVDEACEICGAMTFDIEFHRDKMPTGGCQSRKGCLFCDEILYSTLKTLFGKMSKFSGRKRFGKRGRGRGKGRTRGKEIDRKMTFHGF